MTMWSLRLRPRCVTSGIGTSTYPLRIWLSPSCAYSASAPAKLPPSGKLTLDRHADRRDITIRWEPVKGAQGYNVLWGIAPDKLYSSWMVYDGTELLMKSLTTDQDYYFAVEAFNENGVSLPSEPQYVE